MERLQRLSSGALQNKQPSDVHCANDDEKTFAGKICAWNVKCFLNKEQVDSVDANEIHEKQSEETLSDIKAKKMEKFSLQPSVLYSSSSSFFNLVGCVLLLAYQTE